MADGISTPNHDIEGPIRLIPVKDNHRIEGTQVPDLLGFICSNLPKRKRPIIH